MPITFESERDVIIYAFERFISYASTTQQIFVAHCEWWLASLIGIERGLINHIDIIEGRSNTLGSDQHTTQREVFGTPRDLQAVRRIQWSLDQADKFDKEPGISRNTLGDLILVNPLPPTKAQLRKARKERNCVRILLEAKKISKAVVTNKEKA